MARPQQPTEGLVKGQHDEPVLGHRPLTHQDHREWESQSKEEGKKGCQSLVRRKDFWAERDTHCTTAPSLTCESGGWPASYVLQVLSHPWVTVL